MEHLGVIEVAESCKQNYVCETCDYSTSRKSSYDKHLLTGKHLKTTMTTICSHVCSCGQSYSNRQNLFRHKKTCELAINSTAKVVEVAELLPNAPKQHICECGATFTRNGNMKRHKKVCLHGVGSVVMR